jgi:hypothetical protein
MQIVAPMLRRNVLGFQESEEVFDRFQVSNLSKEFFKKQIAPAIFSNLCQDLFAIIKPYFQNFSCVSTCNFSHVAR